MKEVVGIQVLRGLAAVMVVMFHLAPPVAQAYGIGRFPVGLLASGVDVFFVISGYIMWRTTARPGVRPWPWWRARLIRIVPMYWLALLATLLTFEVHGWAMPTLVDAVKAFAFIPARNPVSGEFTPFFVPGWTLHYEFFFYAVMAALLFLPRRDLRIIAIVLLFGALVALRRFADPSSAVQFRFTSPLMFEFVGGILIARFSESVDLGRHAVHAGLASLVAAVLFVVLLAWRLYPDGPRVVYFGLPALLLVFGTVCLEPAITRHRPVALEAVGDASYSLYLSHTLLMFVPDWLLDRSGVMAVLPRFALSLAVCVVLGIVVYRTIERPLLERMRR